MRYLEDCLDLPLSQIIKAMQDRIMSRSSYFGIKTLKSPIDFWVYQEIIFELKPDFIIEIGNFCGGSTLALAHICDSLGSGNIIGIDISQNIIPDIVKNHRRVTLIEGDACDVFDVVRDIVKNSKKILVIEDSAHTFDNTLKVLELYSSLVAPGGYFIVEDSICHHGLEVGPYPGPYEAINTFLEKNKNFKSDRILESFIVTWNPIGYLKRVL
ncbi:MAG: hypothetical protein EOM12_04925 [Verrucomicrobiae bacterium]|nr:hypothetical protein [Verrucomicrobiae bacterium]